ncbi:MAG TPA: ester cyclase, partial [Thermomicrobiales bacterium]|nr:ester cyclase [Thermomicrobiales bacterium]
MPRILQIAVVCCAFVLVGLVPPLNSPARAQSATPAANCPATTEQENQAIVQRWYDAVDGHDLAAFDDVFAPVVVQHAADFPDATSVDAIKANFAPFLAAFPDLRDRIDQWVTDGDLVAVRGEGSGTQQAEFMGIAPTGRKATWDFLTIFRIECGKIAEQWSEVDALGRLVQLGAVALPGTAPGAPPAAFASPVAMSAPAPAASAATPMECAATTEAENEALVRRFFDEIHTQGDYTHF